MARHSRLVIDYDGAALTASIEPAHSLDTAITRCAWSHAGFSGDSDNPAFAHNDWLNHLASAWPTTKKKLLAQAAKHCSLALPDWLFQHTTVQLPEALQNTRDVQAQLQAEGEHHFGTQTHFTAVPTGTNAHAYDLISLDNATLSLWQQGLQRVTNHPFVSVEPRSFALQRALHAAVSANRPNIVPPILLVADAEQGLLLMAPANASHAATEEANLLPIRQLLPGLSPATGEPTELNPSFSNALNRALSAADHLTLESGLALLPEHVFTGLQAASELTWQSILPAHDRSTNMGSGWQPAITGLLNREATR